MSRRRSLYRRAAFVAAALAAVMACHGPDAAGPSGLPATAAVSRQGAPGGNGKALAAGRDPKPVACRSHEVVSGSGRFGPSGGVLVFGDSRLIIPGGALHDTVTITATGVGDTTSTVNFEPEGLRFFKPVGLVLSGDGCDLPADGVPSVVYLGPDGQVLETIAATYFPRWKAVAAPIEHFSGYAIAF